MLDEIECCDYIKWYRLNRPVLDPEMDKLYCSALLNGTSAGTVSRRRLAVPLAHRDGSAEAAAVPARALLSSDAVQLELCGGGDGGADLNNRNSALGSDNQPAEVAPSVVGIPKLTRTPDDVGHAHTGEQSELGPTSSTRTATATLMDSARPVAVASTRALQPHSVRFECIFRRPAAATASTSAAAVLPLAGAVVATGDHRHNNLCVILERTRSKLDTTVECAAELWRTADGTAQEINVVSERVMTSSSCWPSGGPTDGGRALWKNG
ncbi:hypothetical protein niasHT_018710 [Heterodera trifolii]|uniref:Uncharacterized protein n=1 Tax=Heterodera trifolii TaxID=157864 RepID=A0ABD2LBG5_9BILA